MAQAPNNDAPAKYDAITIDTCIVEGQSFNFDDGILAQLKQFKNANADFIVSDVVVREISKHLAVKTRDIAEKLKKSLHEGAKYHLLSAQAAEYGKKIEATIQASTKIAESRVNSFIESCGAEVIDAEEASMADLRDLYFEAMAPFEADGEKKHEFPDAIALLCIESWATRSDKRVLLVSTDKGWQKFAAGSERLRAFDSLGPALQLLQKHIEGAQGIGRAVLKAITEGSNPAWAASFEDKLNDAVTEAVMYPQAASAYFYEFYQVELSLDGYDLEKKAEQFDPIVVQEDANKVVIQVRGKLQVSAAAEFDLKVRDSIDGDYLTIGINREIRDFTFDAVLLITIEGEIFADEPDLQVASVDWINAPSQIDFGEVSYHPSYSDDALDDDEPDERDVDPPDEPDENLFPEEPTE